MNPKLIFNYKRVEVPGWKGTTCEIGIEGNNLTSLGLDKGKEIVDATVLAWFELNGDEVVAALERTKETQWKGDNYLAAIKAQHKLLDRFCEEANIKDT